MCLWWQLIFSHTPITKSEPRAVGLIVSPYYTNGKKIRIDEGSKAIYLIKIHLPHFSLPFYHSIFLQIFWGITRVWFFAYVIWSEDLGAAEGILSWSYIVTCLELEGLQNGRVWHQNVSLNSPKVLVHMMVITTYT